MPFFDNPKSQFIFGASWTQGIGVSATSSITPIPVDIASGALPVVQIIFNSTGATYYKPKQLTDNANAQAPETTGLQGVISRLQIFNGATFDRVISVPDNADAQAAQVTGMVGTVSRLEGWNGATWDRVQTTNDNADAQPGLALGNLGVTASNYVYNGATWDRQRAANIFRHNAATAANSTAVWTPAAGKKFRLLGFELTITRDATVAVAGVVTVNLIDAAGTIIYSTGVYVPIAATPGNLPAGPLSSIDLGKIGYLSALANNVLNINLSVALVTGSVQVNVRGTEE